MQPRKDEARSRKTTKATTRAAAARLKAPGGAKTDSTKASSDKTKATVKSVPKGKAAVKGKPATAKAKPAAVKAKPAAAKAKPAAAKAKPAAAKAKPAAAKAKSNAKVSPAKAAKVAKAEPKVLPKTAKQNQKAPVSKVEANKPEPKKKKLELAKTEVTKAQVQSATARKPEPAKKAEAEKPAAPKGKPSEAKVVKAPKGAVSDEETRPVEPSRTEPTRSNSAFARPSPWSAPALPPVRADATKPVPAAQDGDFAVGETVVYPGRGVSDIVAIETKDIGGKLQPFYTLRVHDTQQKVFVPVSTAAQAGMRRPISETEIREIFRILKVTDVPMDTQTWNRRFRGFLEKLQTGNVFTIAEVVRDLSRVRLAKDVLSFSERQMLEKARGLIVKEIAIARSKPEEQIREQIDAIFT